MSAPLPFIDTAPTFALKLADRDPSRTLEAYGYVMHRVTVSGWPSTLASVRHQIEDTGDTRHPAGSWTVFCMSRRDIGLDLVETQTFDSAHEAKAFIRDTYTAALRIYEARARDVLRFIRADLSPVEKYDSRCLGDESQQIIANVIYATGPKFGEFESFEMVLTVQEALTLLDRGHVGFAHCSIVGRVIPEREAFGGGTVPAERWRSGFAQWRIPAGSNDYHLAGWRSLTGLGRKPSEGGRVAA